MLETVKLVTTPVAIWATKIFTGIKDLAIALNIVNVISVGFTDTHSLSSENFLKTEDFSC